MKRPSDIKWRVVGPRPPSIGWFYRATFSEPSSWIAVGVTVGLALVCGEPLAALGLIVGAALVPAIGWALHQT